MLKYAAIWDKIKNKRGFLMYRIIQFIIVAVFLFSGLYMRFKPEEFTNMKGQTVEEIKKRGGMLIILGCIAVTVSLIMMIFRF